MIWRVFSALIEDDERNANNRFAVGAELNRWLGFDEGPFWGCPRQHAGPNLSPFRPATHILAERRLCEVPVPKSQPGWKLAYVGSVGSQGLMGIPVLERLRQRLGVTVWPFEPVPAEGPAQVFTELYLSLWPVPAMGGPCKDADQVSAMTAGWRRRPEALARWMTEAYPQKSGRRRMGAGRAVALARLIGRGLLAAEGVQRDHVVAGCCTAASSDFLASRRRCRLLRWQPQRPASASAAPASSSSSSPSSVSEGSCRAKPSSWQTRPSIASKGMLRSS